MSKSRMTVVVSASRSYALSARFARNDRQVLLHLQQLFDPKMVAKTAAGPHGMAEQLDLAEFTLERITHAVNLLQERARRIFCVGAGTLRATCSLLDCYGKCASLFL